MLFINNQQVIINLLLCITFWSYKLSIYRKSLRFWLKTRKLINLVTKQTIRIIKTSCLIMFYFKDNFIHWAQAQWIKDFLTVFVSVWLNHLRYIIYIFINKSVVLYILKHLDSFINIHLWTQTFYIVQNGIEQLMIAFLLEENILYDLNFLSIFICLAHCVMFFVRWLHFLVMHWELTLNPRKFKILFRVADVEADMIIGFFRLINCIL